MPGSGSREAPWETGTAAGQMQAPQPSPVAVVERASPDPQGQGSAAGSTDLDLEAVVGRRAGRAAVVARDAYRTDWRCHARGEGRRRNREGQGRRRHGSVG